MGIFKKAIEAAKKIKEEKPAVQNLEIKKSTAQDNQKLTALLQVKKPLSASEQTFYKLLEKALPEKNILSQVSFHRFLYTSGGGRQENFRLFAKVRQKAVDFLICDEYFNIEHAVELDDKTHNPEKDKERDQYLKQAGIKTKRYHVDNLPDVQGLIEDFSGS